jgi:hypothetical protein
MECDSKVVFKHAISLGANCHASKALQRLGLKKYSCPFDWIFSSIDIIGDCISTDFSKFLDKSQYIDCNVGTPVISHAGILESRAGHKEYGRHMFFHRDPRIGRNYQYYARCVNRWKKVMNGSESKLFVHLVQIPSSGSGECDSNITKLSSMISGKIKNYKILAINAFELSPERKVVTKKDTSELTIVDMFVLGRTNGTIFTDLKDEDLLQGVISRYKFDLAG